MLRLVLSCMVLVGLLTGTAGADSTLSVKTLGGIKDATVFIRTEKDKVAAASGSGFLIRVDGETGYIVTNHHVVHLTQTVERRVPVYRPQLGMPQIGRPQFPAIRPPQPFRPVPAPQLEYRTEIVEIDVPNPNITLVFGSGTKNERSVRAEVLASDAEADLAVLKITGCKNLPQPINLKAPELVETMQVFVFGFPFGQSLSLDKGNPAISVSKASVSSIRTDKNGDIKVVQIDGNVNPGNSGGPVVDANGQLVGVVVAKIRNTQIGMAIPTRDLHLMLAGRAEPPKLTPIKVEKGMIELKVEVGLIDPLERITSLSLHYAPTSTITEAAKKGGLVSHSDSKSVKLQRDKKKATATFSMTLPEKTALHLSYQVSFVTSEGKTLLSEMKASALNDPAPKVETKPPTAVAKTPTPAPNPTVKTPPPIVRPPTPVVKTPTPQPAEKFDATVLTAALQPSQPGDRGTLVVCTLQPLAQGKVLTAEELATVVADLQTPDKAHGAVKRLLGAEVDPKCQVDVARLLEKCAGNQSWSAFARADAATALRRWGNAESVAALLEVVNDRNPHSIHFRHPAMWSMAYLGGDKAIAGIVTRLENFIDRSGVSKMLQQIGSAAEPQVLALLEDKRVEIRSEAANILKTIGTKASGPALFKIVEHDPDANVRNKARDALQVIAARQKKK